MEELNNVDYLDYLISKFNVMGDYDRVDELRKIFDNRKDTVMDICEKAFINENEGFKLNTETLSHLREEVTSYIVDGDVPFIYLPDAFTNGSAVCREHTPMETLLLDYDDVDKDILIEEVVDKVANIYSNNEENK